MNVSGSLDGLFVFSVICDDKTGLGRDVSPAYLFLPHWVKEPSGGWQPGLGVRQRPPFVESLCVPDAVPGVQQQGWYQEPVIQSPGLGSKCLELNAADHFLAA